MRKIYFYEQDGRVHDERELTSESLFDAIGMMARCFLSDGSCHEGFISLSPGIEAALERRDYGSTFSLWTWAHLDEDTNQLFDDEVALEFENFGDYINAVKLFQADRADTIELSEAAVYSWIDDGISCRQFVSI